MIEKQKYKNWTNKKSFKIQIRIDNNYIYINSSSVKMLNISNIIPQHLQHCGLIKRPHSVVSKFASFTQEFSMKLFLKCQRNYV